MPQSPAQKAAWQRRYILGTLTSLSRWVISKRRDIESSALSDDRKARILALCEQLSAELADAAKSLGWKPKV